MKIFISLPMNGRSSEEIIKERKKIFERVLVEYSSAKLIDSFIKEEPPETVKSVGAWYLGKSIQLLAKADLIVFGDGWKSARGCELERAIAEAYGIPCNEFYI